MAIFASLAVNFVARTAELRAGLDRARALNEGFTRRVGRGFRNLTRTLTSFQAIAFGALGVFGGAGAARLADTFTQINNLLRASGFEGEQLGNAFERVSEIAAGTRSDLEATGRLFAVLQRNSASLGANFEEIATVTQVVQQAFALAGASAQEASGATRQLSQALASGVLRGQELNSVMEQAPLIAQAIADNLGVSLGQLRELAAEGRVTSEVVFQSLLNSAEQFNQAFANTTPTFAQLGTILRNRIVPIFGELANRLFPTIQAAANGIARVFEFLSDNLNTVIQTVRILIALLVGRLLTAVIPALITGIGAFATAVVTGTIATRGLALAMGALGGPVGLIIQAFTVLATIFSDQLVDAFRIGVNFIIRQLNRLIGVLNTVRGFFGLEAVGEIRMWMAAIEETGDAVSNLNFEFQDLTLNLDETTNMVSAFESTLQEAANTADRISQFGSRVFDGLADGLTDFVTTGRFMIRDFARDVIREFIRIQIRASLSQAIGGGGFLGGLFGGFRQQGGPVQAGQAYIVGEAGPELFVPNANGAIVPNRGAGGGGGGSTTNVYEINAVDAQSFQQLVARDPEFIAGVVRRGERRTGLAI